MIIRPSTIMRNDYNLISAYAHEKNEIIFLTKHGKGDLVVMSIKTFEKRDQQLRFYNVVLQGEKERQKNIDDEELLGADDIFDRLRAKFID